MTDEERQLLEAVLADLVAEEEDQQREQGHASSRLLRAAARLGQLLDSGPGPDEVQGDFERDLDGAS